MVDAIVKEIALRKNYLPDGNIINTIYFGGGTPSLLNSFQFEKIFNAINKVFSLSADTEITLEANPDDLNLKMIMELKNSPVNRLSIGVQSFFDDDLRFMNRAHDAAMALNSVKLAADKGFDNITIDLIYGLPGLSDERWNQNMQQAFELPIQHLSCYALTVEKKTPLNKLIREGKIKQVEDDKVAAQFEMLMMETARNNFEQYEISNFAKNGMYSRHNSSYWKNVNYIGLGPSAHSYDGSSRQWNIASNVAYINAITDNKIPSTVEFLTMENKFNEYIFTRLRTKWGINMEDILRLGGPVIASGFIHDINAFIKSNDVIADNETYKLTSKGKLIADRIASALFILPGTD